MSAFAGSSAMPRLFFALWPDENSRLALLSTAREVIQASRGRWVPDESLHVTLAFLGSVPDAKLDSLLRIAARVAAERVASEARVQLEFDRIEYWRKARVLCATSTRPPTAALAGLAGSLSEQLAAGGFHPDRKPFRAHVTLARKPDCPTPHPIDLPPVVWRFTDFVLVESRTEQQRPVYRVLHRLAQP